MVPSTVMISPVAAIASDKKDALITKMSQTPVSDYMKNRLREQSLKQSIQLPIGDVANPTSVVHSGGVLSNVAQQQQQKQQQQQLQQQQHHIEAALALDTCTVVSNTQEDIEDLYQTIADLKEAQVVVGLITSQVIRKEARDIERLVVAYSRRVQGRKDVHRINKTLRSLCITESTKKASLMSKIESPTKIVSDPEETEGTEPNSKQEGSDNDDNDGSDYNVDSSTTVKDVVMSQEGFTRNIDLEEKKKLIHTRTIILQRAYRMKRLAKLFTIIERDQHLLINELRQCLMERL